jgi:hypothetical protein
MRHGAVIVGLSLTVVLTGCASNERPEGVVERWLLSLNQGAAGTPERYGGDAAVTAANAILPDWRTRDPGSLERVQVGGNPAWAKGMAGAGSAVPFRIETTDGHVIEGVAEVARCDADGEHRCITGAGIGGITYGSSPITWSAGAHASDWAWAVAAAVLLSLLAVGVVSAVGRTARPAAATEP